MARQTRPGEVAWSQTEKINAELFAFTYGSLVVKLIKELDSLSKVNETLETMGFNIGKRLIDDFLSKNEVNCDKLQETADTIAKIGFKVYLGISCEVANWTEDSREYPKEFSLVITENPMTEFVELREDYRELSYCNLICGVIRGCLQMLKFESKVFIVKDTLKGDEITEIRVVVNGRKEDEYEPDDE
jgi:hypothetical protein